MVAIVPPHRRDVAIEEDIAEEVVRLRGYDSLAPTLPDTTPPGYRREASRLVYFVRDALAGRGLSEVVTNSLISPNDHAALGFGSDDPAIIRLENPVTVDHSELRRSLLPSMIQVLARNERQRRLDVAVFEIGNVHEMTGTGPHQREVLGLLMAGAWRSQSWSEPARSVSVDDLKGIVEVLASRLNIGPLSYRPAGEWSGVEHPGRTADIYAESEGLRVDVGRVGELHPRYLAGYDIRAERVAFAALEMAALRRLAQPQPQVRTVYSLPAVERDIAVVVDRDTPAADVEAAIRRNAGPFLARIDLFDRYQGAPLATNEVSLAYRLRFQPRELALSEAQIETSVADIAAGLEREVGGRIRSGG
jgi:phenylalanyl-tRNA synthetase beta chain